MDFSWNIFRASMDLQIEIRVIHNGFVHNIFSDAFKCCRENMQRDRNGQIVLLNRLASCHCLCSVCDCLYVCDCLCVCDSLEHLWLSKWVLCLYTPFVALLVRGQH